MSENVLTPEQELAMIKELEQYDTGTITNVVATYPGASTCLSLYAPWDVNWYTDQSIKVLFPEMGPRCGYAVTCVYGLPDPAVKDGPGLIDILRAMDETPKPVVLVIKQDFPDRIKGKIGLCGANMTTAFKSMGTTAIISDGPSRDVEDVRAMGVQYMLTGTSAGHGKFQVKAVNVPVEICGMDVAPGEIIHMDANGAVKFPRKYLPQVVEYCKQITAEEHEKQSWMASTNDPELIARYMKGQYN
ncbi:MAG: RraA family protein [Atopobiaceae bacterium]|nr:RraA family protein [Atopobiaceae bacterium]